MSKLDNLLSLASFMIHGAFDKKIKKPLCWLRIYLTPDITVVMLANRINAAPEREHEAQFSQIEE